VAYEKGETYLSTHKNLFWVNYIALTEHKLYLKINEQLSVMTSNLKKITVAEFNVKEELIS
jgi:hypothetical protein